MANVFRSKEVYKHLKYELHDRNEIVPVQGVYVSGEYRPPYYNNPVLMIYEISSNDCFVEDFQTDETDVYMSETAGIYDFGFSDPVFDIQRYSAQYLDTDIQKTSGIYSIDFADPTFTIIRYGREYQDFTDNNTAGIYDISLQTPTTTFERYSQHTNGSTPEPILRLSTLTSDKATVENYT